MNMMMKKMASMVLGNFRDCRMHDAASRLGYGSICRRRKRNNQFRDYNPEPTSN